LTAFRRDIVPLTMLPVIVGHSGSPVDAIGPGHWSGGHPRAVRATRAASTLDVWRRGLAGQGDGGSMLLDRSVVPVLIGALALPRPSTSTGQG